MIDRSGDRPRPTAWPRPAAGRSLSNVFVDPRTMPGWLQEFVEVNPITHLVGAIRSIMGGAWDMGEVMWTLVASAVLVAVFGTLTMRLYNRKCAVDLAQGC